MPADRDDTYSAYNNALRAVNDGNRAPLILGNHMNEWVCGAYKKALSPLHRGHPHERDPMFRFISTLDLVNWMEAQDPAVLAELQSAASQRSSGPPVATDFLPLMDLPG